LLLLLIIVWLLLRCCCCLLLVLFSVDCCCCFIVIVIVVVVVDPLIVVVSCCCWLLIVVGEFDLLRYCCWCYCWLLFVVLVCCYCYWPCCWLLTVDLRWHYCWYCCTLLLLLLLLLLIVGDCYMLIVGQIYDWPVVVWLRVGPVGLPWLLLLIVIDLVLDVVVGVVYSRWFRWLLLICYCCCCWCWFTLLMICCCCCCWLTPVSRCCWLLRCCWTPFPVVVDWLLFVERSVSRSDTLPLTDCPAWHVDDYGGGRPAGSPLTTAPFVVIRCDRPRCVVGIWILCPPCCSRTTPRSRFITPLVSGRIPAVTALAPRSGVDAATLLPCRCAVDAYLLATVWHYPLTLQLTADPLWHSGRRLTLRHWPPKRRVTTWQRGWRWRLTLRNATTYSTLLLVVGRLPSGVILFHENLFPSRWRLAATTPTLNVLPLLRPAGW